VEEKERMVEIHEEARKNWRVICTMASPNQASIAMRWNIVRRMMAKM
jgi:hypothetical protein